ncbi:putative protein FAR1-RELATED SEQUENCE 10 isoform X1 [Hevea brasiliensis]|uniref:putative protein FAR1-RELATED SEQUENCE 10 isoform X1 n=1 Tax=Hevea brasiliensis TaxID=3981 RepID=UPI0025D3EA73|nr:putative protein FAR1-RELATED SEQUENCE 10 isoform X1 [Hevea brasiliensis]
MSEGTSIVMESSENGTDISHDDTGNMEKIPDDTILSQQTAVNLVPFTKDLSLKMLPMNLIAVLQSNVAFPLDVTVLVEGMILVEEAILFVVFTLSLAAEIIDLSNHTEVKAQTQRRTQKVYIKTGSLIESQAASVFTPYTFNKFQEELVLAPLYASFPIDQYCYQVTHHTRISRGCKVIWDPCQEHISCGCNQ